MIGQLRQTFNLPSSSPSSSASVALARDPPSPCSPTSQLHPLTFDPLQGLIHEMALSAVIQKHTASLPSSIITSSAGSLPTTYVQNIVVQPPHTPSPSIPSPDSLHHTSTIAQPHNLIAVTSAATKASTMNPMPFLAQGVSAGTQLYGAPITLQQFGAPAGQEVATAVSASAGTPIVQLAPVGYAPPTGASQGDNRTAIFQSTGVIRCV